MRMRMMMKVILKFRKVRLHAQIYKITIFASILWFTLQACKKQDQGFKDTNLSYLLFVNYEKTMA